MAVEKDATVWEFEELFKFGLHNPDHSFVSAGLDNGAH
jgi:hypothetical protein